MPGAQAPAELGRVAKQWAQPERVAGSMTTQESLQVAEEELSFGLSVPGQQTSRRAKRARELMWVASGQGAAALGAVVGVRMLTRVFPPSSYGESALLMTGATLILQLILLPLGGGVLRFFAPAQQERQVGAFVRAVLRIFSLASAGVLVLALAVAVVFWGLNWTHRLAGLGVLLAYALVFGWSVALDGIQNAAQQRVIVALHQGAAQWLRPLLAIALIPLMGNSGTVILLGWSAASVVVLVSQVLFLRPLLRREQTFNVRPRREDMRRWTSTVLSYSLPFMSWGLFTWAQLASNRWALETFRSRSDVGLYTAVFQLGYLPMTLLSTVAGQFVTPIIFARAGDGSDRSRVAAACRLNERLPLLFLLGTVVLSGLMFLLHQLVGSLFLGSAYRNASYLLPWMVLAGGIFAASQLATIGLLSSAKTRQLIAPKVVTSLLGILFVAFGAWRFGLEGVAGGLIAFSCSCCVWNFALLRQYRVAADHEELLSRRLA